MIDKKFFISMKPEEREFLLQKHFGVSTKKIKANKRYFKLLLDTTL